MVINLFENDEQAKKIGGGITFLRNFKKGLEELGYQVSSEGYDISVVCGATMVPRDEFMSAMDKPVVLRVDGLPEDFRNRGTGWSRLSEYASLSKLLVYQSNFSLCTTGALLGVDGPIVMNGVDTSIFNPFGVKLKLEGNPKVVSVNFRKDPNKRWYETYERFRQLKVDEKDAYISFVGIYPEVEAQYGFGLSHLKEGKDYRYFGVISDQEQLAVILRGHNAIAFPSFADPCPNTLIEALSCGLDALWVSNYGSSLEIISKFDSGYDFSLKYMTDQYLKEFERIL